MKNLIISFLPLAVSSAVILPRVPQTTVPTISPNSPLGPLADLLKGKDSASAVATLLSVLPKAKLAKVENLKPQLRASAKRINARYGPYVLAGKAEPKPKATVINSLDPNGQAFMEVLADGLCANCTVLAGRTRVSYEDGSDAGPTQGVYIHHVISRDLAKPVNLPISKCGEGQTRTRVSLGSEFLAQGDDSAAGSGSILFTSADGRFDSGFFVGANSKMMSQVDLVNYNPDSKSVYVNYEIEYVEGNVGSDAAAVLMSVTGCQDMNMQNQPKQVQGGPPVSAIKLNQTGIAETQSPKFPITNNGKIIAAMGHMHDGGSAMILYINDREVCASQAVYGPGGGNNEETIHHMSGCDTNIPVKKGDVLTMKSVYDLKTHPLRAGGEHNAMGMADVMAMFYLTFAIDEVKT